MRAGNEEVRSLHWGAAVRGGAALGGEVAWGRLHSQEVKPEDKMATDSKNGDIIALSQRR
jgi:hypothetical protein